jgi:deoxyribose-phosphate aldolase
LKPQTGIKASGGVSTLEKTLAVLNVGATRIGTSSGIAILDATK